MPRALQYACMVISEDLFEAPSFGLLESGVPIAPDNHCWLVPQACQIRFDFGQVGAAVKDLSGENCGRHPRRACREGASIGTHLCWRKVFADPRRDRQIDECVEIENEKARNRTPSDSRKPFQLPCFLRRPGPGIADEQSTDPTGVTPSDTQSNRASPILYHQTNVAEVERPDKFLDHSGMFARLEAIAGSRNAQTKTGVVNGDAAEPS